MAIPFPRAGIQRVLRPRTWNVVRLGAIAALLVSLVGLVSSLWLWAGQRFAVPPVMFSSGPVVVGEMILALAYAAVGTILATRRPRNVIGWAFLGIGLSTAVQMPVSFLVAEAHQVLRPMPATTLYAAWLASTAHLPFAAALAITVFTVFPDGRPLSRRWIAPIPLAVAGTLLISLAAGLSPEGLIWYPSLSNPFAAPSSWAPLIVVVSISGAVLTISGLVLAATSMVLRYRRTDDAGQAQLRWIVYAIVMLAATAAPFLAVRYAMGASIALGNTLLTAMIVAGCFLPIAAAVAIMRYRLFDIDLIINRTLVYVPLVAFLGGLFTASITLSQRLFMGLTGNTSDFAIVLTTLLVASAITPVRHGLESLVDRHVKPPHRPATTPVSPRFTAASTAPEVSSVLAAAGFADDHGPARAATEGPDLIALIGHLNERIEELQERLEHDEERFAGQPPVGGPRSNVDEP